MTGLPEGFFDRPVAHRALHGPGRPENGLSAIRAAVDGGYGIEVDVQLSSDGRAMVFHDATLDRMTAETGPIQSRTAGTLAETRLLDTDDRIPTLSEALKVIAGRGPLVIEIKDQSGRFGRTDGDLEAAVARDLKGYPGAVAVMSFNPHSVARMRDLAPGVPRGLTTGTFAGEGLGSEQRRALAGMTMMDETQSCFISHDVDDLSSPSVGAVRAKGLPILCWTVRSQSEANKARKVADQITFEGFAPS